MVVDNKLDNWLRSVIIRGGGAELGFSIFTFINRYRLENWQKLCMCGENRNLFGKLINGGDYLNKILADSMSNNLIFLKNTLSSSRFLVDTGASVSVFPNQPRSPSSPGVGVQLRTADSSPWIPMEPTVMLFSSVLDSLVGVFYWQMSLCLYLGSDFLQHFHLS